MNTGKIICDCGSADQKSPAIGCNNCGNYYHCCTLGLKRDWIQSTSAKTLAQHYICTNCIELFCGKNAIVKRYEKTVEEAMKDILDKSNQLELIIANSIKDSNNNYLSLADEIDKKSILLDEVIKRLDVRLKANAQSSYVPTDFRDIGEIVDEKLSLFESKLMTKLSEVFDEKLKNANADLNLTILKRKLDTLEDRLALSVSFSNRNFNSQEDNLLEKAISEEDINASFVQPALFNYNWQLQASTLHQELLAATESLDDPSRDDDQDKNDETTAVLEQTTVTVDSPVLKMTKKKNKKKKNTQKQGTVNKAEVIPSTSTSSNTNVKSKSVTFDLKKTKGKKEKKDEISTSDSSSTHDSRVITSETLKKALDEVLPMYLTMNKRNHPYQGNSRMTEKGIQPSSRNKTFAEVVKTTTQRQLIYLKHVSPQYNESDIIKYIKRQFNFTDFTCHKVVPYHMKGSELNYVNFKLCVPYMQASKMLDAANWPWGTQLRPWKTNRNNHMDGSSNRHHQNFQTKRRQF